MKNRTVHAAENFYHDAQLRQIWQQIDTNDNGSLDIGEFTRAVKDLDIPIPLGKTKAQIFEELDTDNSGAIEWEEFVEFVRMNPIVEQMVERLHRSQFEMLSNQQNEIPYKTFYKKVKLKNWTLTDSLVDRLFEKLSGGSVQRGKITYGRFKMYFNVYRETIKQKLSAKQKAFYKERPVPRPKPQGFRTQARMIGVDLKTAMQQFEAAKDMMENIWRQHIFTDKSLPVHFFWAKPPLTHVDVSFGGGGITDSELIEKLHEVFTSVMKSIGNVLPDNVPDQFSQIVMHDIFENSTETELVPIYPQVYLTGISRRVFAAFADVLNEEWAKNVFTGEFQTQLVEWQTPFDKPVYVNIVFRQGVSEPKVELLRDKLLTVMGDTLRQMAGYVTLDKAYDDRVEQIECVPILHPDEQIKAEKLDEEEAQRQLTAQIESDRIQKEAGEAAKSRRIQEADETARREAQRIAISRGFFRQQLKTELANRGVGAHPGAGKYIEDLLDDLMPVYKGKDDLTKEDFWFASDEWVEMKTNIFHKRCHIPEKLLSPAERGTLEKMVESREKSPLGRVSFAEVVSIFQTEIDNNFMHMKKRDVREWFDQQPSVKYLHTRNKLNRADTIDGRVLLKAGAQEKKSKKKKSKRSKPTRELAPQESARSIFSDGGDPPEDITDNDLDEMLMDFPQKIKKWSIDDVQTFVKRLHGSMKKPAKSLAEYQIDGKKMLKLNRDDIKDMNIKKSARRGFLHRVIRKLRQRKTG